MQDAKKQHQHFDSTVISWIKNIYCCWRTYCDIVARREQRNLNAFCLKVCGSLEEEVEVLDRQKSLVARNGHSNVYFHRGLAT